MRKRYVDISSLVSKVDFNNISSILKNYEEIHLLVEEMNLFLKELEGSVSIFMKERKWTTYKDKETNIPVNIEQVESRVVDQKMLQVLLNEEQISRVVRKKKEEKISILTKDKIERLKKYGKR